MLPTLQEIGVDQMNTQDRIALAQAIWDSIASEPHERRLSETQRQELERRLADHVAHPEDVIPWERVKEEALARWQK